MRLSGSGKTTGHLCVSQRDGVHKGVSGFEAWVREGDAVEEARGAALRCSVIFHIALGRMSTLRRILNTIIALRLVLINISLTLGFCIFETLTKISCSALLLECLSDWALTLGWLL